MSKVGENIIEVIKEKELQKVSAGIVESVIDADLQNGLLKQIPFMSTIVGTLNAVTSIQDRLFLKKLLRFLHELSSVPLDKRIEQIIKIEDDKKYETKVGEKLLFIINKCDDIDKASLIGKLFKVYLEDRITYDEFIACVSCIERTPLPELLNFIRGDWDEISTDAGGSELVAYGLMEIRITKPRVKIARNSPYDNQDKYAPSEEEVLESKVQIIGFDALCHVTSNGAILRNNLQ